MRRLLFVLILIFMLIGTAYGQNFGQAVVNFGKIVGITFDLDSTETQNVYVSFPYPDHGFYFRVDTTRLKSAERVSTNQLMSGTGNVFVNIVIDSLTRDESDSLAPYMKPFSYSVGKKYWYESENDSLFIDFTTAGDYTSTSAVYLDHSHEKMYTAQLSGWMWSSGGLVFKFSQTANDVAGAKHRVYFTIMWMF